MPMPQAPTLRAIKLSNKAIARDAARWIGQGYVYGGNASRPGDWDCSSFVSWVLGHDLHLALPGGRWGDPDMPPNIHGPVVVDYANWDGATTVTTPIAGDLCCFVGEGPNGHIGIAVSPTEMVSALNPEAGTLKTGIVGYGPAGAPLIYRRVNGIAVLGTLGPSGRPSSGRPPLEVAALVAVLFAGALILAAAGASLLAAGGVWAVRKAAG